MSNTCECDKIKELLKQIETLTAQRDEARSLVGRAFELASPFNHPAHWLGLLRVYSKAEARWKSEANNEKV